ncbi:MAG: high light inducible protein [Symploca sp. SIO2E9]|nr:high light inducible protein [Symploca sp. SIO2E9]
MQEQGNKFGFTNFSEIWNGRLAMLGFVIGIATELLTGQGILQQLGLM